MAGGLRDPAPNTRAARYYLLRRFCRFLAAGRPGTFVPGESLRPRRLQALAGTRTETGLVALLQCGPGDELGVVAVSPRTFTITRTLIPAGSCLGGETISLAPAARRRCSRNSTTGAGRWPRPAGTPS